MAGADVSAVALAAVSLGAGYVRGFTGFGGPAFILAILTLFYTPLAVLPKVLIVEFASSAYLFLNIRHRIDWRSTASLALPTMLTMPLGHWLLLTTDPLSMRRVIAAIILATCVAMLVGYRYRRPLGAVAMGLLGIVSGVVFGATYIALVVVATVLLGPYDKHEARTLIISWTFLVALCFGAISIYSGSTTLRDLHVALPGAALYFAGAWIGSRWFRNSKEEGYRRFALLTLLLLATLGVVT
jgi:uncharacterized membrane protein YfcA